MATFVFPAPCQVPFFWIVLTTIGEAFAYLHVAPVVIALFSRVAPASTKATMMGVYFLAIFFGSLISGRLGGYYEQWSATKFWLIHAVIVCAAGLLLPVVGRSLRGPSAELFNPQPESAS